MKYFAYGSNMATKRIGRRVASAQVIETCLLKQHDLRFHKKGKDNSAKCDAFYTGMSRDFIWGVLYWMDPKHKPALDHAEGRGNGYEVKIVSVTGVNGHFHRALTYYATHIEPSLKPYNWYKNHVMTGALEAGLCENYIDRIRRVESIADPDTERSKMEYGIVL